MNAPTPASPSASTSANTPAGQGESETPSATTFDFIVIGGGTAGSLVANRLSAHPQKRVLLLEAGGKDDYHWIHVPVGYLYCIGNPRTDWLYNTQAEPGLNGRSLRYPRGKTLGGSSSINGMIYMRGQSRDFEAWAAATGDADWGWQSCLADFMAHEDHYKLDTASTDADPAHRSAFAQFHGNKSQPPAGEPPSIRGQRLRPMGGEWRVEKQRLRWEILDAFAAAATQYGIAPTEDFNRGNNAGVGYFEVNQKNGWRWNTAKAFLRPTCYGRPNFEMWTRAQVSRLVLVRQADGSQRCTGVQVWSGRELVTVHATQEVIVCAGSIGSPQILQLSGIGCPDKLKAAGVDPVVPLAGVGANLSDHLQIRSIYQITGAATLNTLTSTRWGKLKMGLEYAFKRTGPLSMAPSQLGAFTKSSPELAWPNLQYHVQPLSLDAFGEPLHSFDAFTASVCNLNPTSRGHVDITSPRFEDAPTIAPNYLSTEEDRQIAAQSLRVTRGIVGQSALARFSPREIKPGVQYESDADLARMAGDIGSTIFHPVGTCKMGQAGDERAVVDSHLRVRGVAGLRVVDASVMPSITSGNTNSPTLMIAEKAARWILAGQ